MEGLCGTAHFRAKIFIFSDIILIYPCSQDQTHTVLGSHSRSGASWVHNIKRVQDWAREDVTRVRTRIPPSPHTQTRTLYGKRVSELPYVYSFNSAHLVHMRARELLEINHCAPKRPEFSTVDYHFITPKMFRGDTQLFLTCHQHTKLVCLYGANVRHFLNDRDKQIPIP